MGQNQVRVRRLHFAAGIAVGMAVAALVALPTCISVSSWHVWWGVALTIPVCIIGIQVGARIGAHVIKRLAHREDEIQAIRRVM